ncbi:MAG: BMP family ABC transporter substrate-binding protein [Leptolyngbyaceae cyanobacterium RM2_2_4]|nr:BMP family ABC transporter substrate-binding protein [Leptolyngbyaceae cyanobacterium SM1_4_3]NJO49928.1 BMP family ABC transporter substrate-binding protein [Leptolyngbyaceae cyanobacterium RM2_2_4]NJO75191.1 BMP family ABC transporter substrate-binding protein [Leptolyngbyaceae cyanobacterium RM1_406_9]
MTTPFTFRRFLPTLLSFSLSMPLLMLAACGQSTTSSDTDSEATNTAETEDSANAPRMALVLSGSSTDQSWDQAAFEAGERLEEQGVEVAVSEAVDPANVAAVLRQYAEQEYDLIVAHSFSYQDAVFEVAEEFPEVNFAWAGGIGETAENVADYDQPFYQGAYLIGLVAAELSETGQLGALYGYDIPVCHAMGEAMLAGAQQVRPDATLISAAVGDWYDVAKAKEAALSQAETGVDFWIGCGQGPTLGQIEAAKESGGYATGYVGDMSSLGPEVVASNLIWNMEPLFQQMLDDTAAGTFADQFYNLAIPEGVIQVEVSPAFQDEVGEEVLKSVEETKEQIAAGELEVPFVPN